MGLFKSMTLCTHLWWCTNFVRVESHWFVEGYIWILSITACIEGKVHDVLTIENLFLLSVQRCRLGESRSIAGCESGRESVASIIHVDCIGGGAQKFFSLCVWDYYFVHNKIYSVFLLHQEGCARLYRATPFIPQAGLELLEVSMFVKSSGTNDLLQTVKIYANGSRCELGDTWNLTGQNPEKPDMLWRGVWPK